MSSAMSLCTGATIRAYRYTTKLTSDGENHVPPVTAGKESGIRSGKW